MSITHIEDEEFFVALGRVAYSSANLSLVVEEFIMGILATGDGCAVVTVDLNYSQLTHLANALADRLIKGKKEFATISAILKDASQCYERRNTVMHGEWSGSNGIYYRVAWRAKGKLVMMDNAFSIKELFEISAALDECRNRLQNFCKRKRFLERTMLDEDIGVRRLAQRERARRREQARILSQQKKEPRKRQP